MQKQFAAAFVETNGDRRAALRACGSTSAEKPTWSGAAYRFLQEPGVMQYIAVLECEKHGKPIPTELLEYQDVNKRGVIAIINESIEKARRGKPIIQKNGEPMTTLNPDTGREEVIFVPDLTALQNGAKLLGQTLAMFTEKHQITSTLEHKSDAQLRDMFETALADPMILDFVARLTIVRKKVHELECKPAGSGEGDGGASEPEAQPVSPSPEAAGVPQGRIH